MLIEQATVDNAFEILALQQRAYLSEAKIYNDFSIQPLVQTLEEVQREFESHTVFKTVWEGAIIGSVRALLRQGTCHIGKLIVHPAAQNQGIGSALMRHLDDYYSQAARFELFTGEKSLRNLYLYRKLGYIEYKRQQTNDNLWFVYLAKNVAPRHRTAGIP